MNRSGTYAAPENTSVPASFTSAAAAILHRIGAAIDAIHRGIVFRRTVGIIQRGKCGNLLGGLARLLQNERHGAFG